MKLKAYISTFPWKIIVSMPDGRIFSSHDQDELFLEMERAEIIGAEYEWAEHVWDKKLFPVLATWTHSADGTIVTTLPDGSTFKSKDQYELLQTVVQAGATGMVDPDAKYVPVAHSDDAGNHQFTDRGNRFTFDRAIVSDEDIRLTLVTAQQRYGCPLHLTGDDQIFTARMVRLAGEMGIAIAR